MSLLTILCLWIHSLDDRLKEYITISPVPILYFRDEELREFFQANLTSSTTHNFIMVILSLWHGMALVVYLGLYLALTMQNFILECMF